MQAYKRVLLLESKKIRVKVSLTGVRRPSEVVPSLNFSCRKPRNYETEAFLLECFWFCIQILNGRRPNAFQYSNISKRSMLTGGGKPPVRTPGSQKVTLFELNVSKRSEIEAASKFEESLARRSPWMLWNPREIRKLLQKIEPDRPIRRRRGGSLEEVSFIFQML